MSYMHIQYVSRYYDNTFSPPHPFAPFATAPFFASATATSAPPPGGRRRISGASAASADCHAWRGERGERVQRWHGRRHGLGSMPEKRLLAYLRFEDGWSFAGSNRLTTPGNGTRDLYSFLEDHMSHGTPWVQNKCLGESWNPLVCGISWDQIKCVGGFFEFVC